MKKILTKMLSVITAILLVTIFRLTGETPMSIEEPDILVHEKPKPKKMSHRNEYILATLVGLLKESPISRINLVYLLETSDRNLRMIINEARKRGIPILTSDGMYYISDNVADINNFIVSEIESRIDDLLETKVALTFTMANGGKYES